MNLFMAGFHVSLTIVAAFALSVLGLAVNGLFAGIWLAAAILERRS